MKLSQLMEGIEYTLLEGDLSTDVSEVCYDSRQVVPGALFVCMNGLITDGHQYVQEALDKGATAVIAEKKVVLKEGIVLLLCSNSRKILPRLAANFYARPSDQIRLVGVTGTNGKTTTTHLILEILRATDKKAAILGTLYGKYQDLNFDFGHTTPESVEIEALLAAVCERDGEYMVMEVSSHALVQERVQQLRFSSAVFTNLTQDHLDYHATMEQYAEAKSKLFAQVEAGADTFVIINRDDAWAEYFMEHSRARMISYGLHENADLWATKVKLGLEGSSFRVHYQGQKYDFAIPLIGQFSVYNALAAIAWGVGEGIAMDKIRKALEAVEGVAGRFEQVKAGQEFAVVVDYAHTPDGLENILKTARELTGGRLITIFGCGGDRDRGKRPLMGEIAARYSDFCIVTSDNPRTEDPEAIIDEILPGVRRVEAVHYAKIVDRRDAIHHGLAMARAGDMVVIAGKGHENYQLVGNQVLDFDDRLVAREIMKGMLI